MPIEIKELHIRVAVNVAPDEKAPADQAPSGGGAKNAGADRGAIVADCVEQVLQILQNKSER